MSRFFRAADDTSSSSSESSESSDEEQTIVAARTTVGGGAAGGRSRFLASDSDEDDVRRVSKSAKDRQFDALVETSNNIKSHLKNNDWGSLQQDFDALNDQLVKVRKKDMVSGVLPPVPEIYLRSIITLEDALKRTLEEKPKMSKTNATSLNKMKLRLPKNSRLFTAELAALRETGKGTLYDIVEESDDDTDDDVSSESSSSESDDVPPGKPATAQAAGGGENDDADDDSDWPSDSDSDSESSDDGEGFGGKASRWLKKDTSETAVKAKKTRKTGTGRETGDATGDMDPEEVDDGFTTVDRRRNASKPIIRAEEMTEESVDSKMHEVLQARGRRGTNKKEQIEIISQLVAAAKSPRQKLEITLHLISAQFDSVPAAKMFMPAQLWRDALANAIKVVELAKTHFPRIRFSDETDPAADEPLVLVREDGGQGEIIDPSGVAIAGAQDAAAAAAAQREAAAAKAAAEASGQIIVRGNLALTFELLDDELYKSWQNTDAYSLEYVDRLKDEVGLLKLAAATQMYFEKGAEAEEIRLEEARNAAAETETEGNVKAEDLDEARLNVLRSRAARIATRRIIHMYYKSSDLTKRVCDLSGAEEEDRSLGELATLVYRYGEDDAKSQTMLAHIYNHALNNRFYEARDMLLMSHLQETIGGVKNLKLQVMFNRAMVQLGLCAFRLGKAWEAHSCLQDACSPSYGGGGGGPARLKELLAQGMTQHRGYEKTVEEEKEEMRRQIPYHMHMNLDLVETAHLTSAMLLEVPAMALSKARGDVRRWPISKSFQYFLRSSMKQAFPGPPENTRDFVMAATRCMMKGEWEMAYNHICGIRSWKSLTPTERKSTLERLKELVKVEALRTFTLSYSSYFESMSVVQLSALYDLPSSRVHSVLSKMIINGELRASWDQPTGCMVMRRTEPSRLQSLALQLSAKVVNMTDNNEKLLDAKSGGGDRDRDGKHDRDGKGDWKSGGGRGGRGRSGGGGRSGGYGGRDRERSDGHGFGRSVTAGGRD